MRCWAGSSAPLRVPLERRLQTLAASLWFITFGFGNIIAGLVVLAILLYSYYLRWLLLPYLAWVWYDKDICERGGRRNMSTRSFIGWHYFREYFPLRLEKTVDLTPDRNYLFCVFPHGVLSAGAFGQFGNEFAPFRDMFPGLEPYVHTLHIHFITPFFRELVLGLGGCSASSKSINWVLGAPGVGRAGILIVGGAAESLHCRPGVYRVILSRRKGFVKIALKNGTPLVPVFSFGETNLYDQMHNPEGSLLRRFQEFVRRKTTVAPVIPIGRGYFQYSFGLVPRRSLVTTVVGPPVEVPKIPDPTNEDVDKYHKLFQDSLTTLFEENKHKYIPNADNTFLEIE
ncbi:2-acylglycerol O-acyltransferase 2-A [Gryllus bimaculatus]|nr:2-acylglycerol O-acyltransferase 2-A [Gryllus bimaculatus]